MAGKGGYQAPANPAPVSGPGSMSRRTDGQAVRNPGGLPYGDNQDLRTQQLSAPMSGQTVGTGDQPMPPAVPLTQMTPDLFAPTRNPDEPITAGVDIGPGPGSEALGTARMPDGPSRARLQAILPVLARAAEQPYSSPELRAIVSLLRSTS